MAHKITISEVKENARSQGWKCISMSYKNLDSELEFVCPEGHHVFTSFKKFRYKPICPICKNNYFKDMDKKVVKKEEDTVRVLAVDQATRITGFSVYDGPELVKYGTFQTTLQDKVERMVAVRQWLMSMIYEWQPDIVAIEDIQLQTFGKAQHAKDSNNIKGIQTFKDLAQLQGALLTLIEEQKIKIKICMPMQWKAHCKLRGRSRADQKKSAELKIKEWFDITVSNDEADAIAMGKYAVETRQEDEFLFGGEV